MVLAGEERFWAMGFFVNYAAAVVLAGLGCPDVASGLVCNALFCGMQNLEEE